MEKFEKLQERGYNVFEKFELDEIRHSRNSAEAVGVCWMFSMWVEDETGEDAREVYDNLSGDRGGRWDLIDNIEFVEDCELGGVVLNGNVVLAEIWYDDEVVGYVRVV